MRPATDAAGAGQPDQLLGRLDVRGHFVAVVLAALVEAVDRIKTSRRAARSVYCRSSTIGDQPRVVVAASLSLISDAAAWILDP